MGREEQLEEREVLGSIFPDEITGETSAPFQQNIQINPSLPGIRYLRDLFPCIDSIGCAWSK